MMSNANELQAFPAQLGPKIALFSLRLSKRANRMFEETPPAFEQPTEDLTRQQNFFQAYAAAPRPVVTFALIAINFLVFVAMVVNGISFTDPSAEDALRWGANFGPLTVNGEWWRLLTSCFVHFGIIHIAMNMFILYQVGMFTEKLFGNLRFLVLYVVAGLGGSLAGLFIHPNTVSAGASGAVFGVYGAMLAFLLVQRGTVPSSTSLPIARSAGVFLGINLVYGLATPHTDMTAHIGGLVFGFAAGCLLAMPLTPAGQKAYPVRTAAVVLAAVVLAVIGLKTVPQEKDSQRIWYQTTKAGQRVTVGKNDSVIYDKSVTKAEAASLAQALTTVGYFKNPDVIAFLSSDSDGKVLSIPTWTHGSTKSDDLNDKGNALPWDDPAFLAGMREAGVIAAPSVGGPPLKVRVLDDEGDVEKELRITERVVTIGKLDSVWYSGAATAQDAQALGAAMQSAGFFEDKGGRAILSRSGASTDVSLLVREGIWDDPSMAGTIRDLGHSAAKALGGGPIQLHLLDGKLQEKKVLTFQ
jgi:rhomboid protease GluP